MLGDTAVVGQMPGSCWERGWWVYSSGNPLHRQAGGEGRDEEESLFWRKRTACVWQCFDFTTLISAMHTYICILTCTYVHTYMYVHVHGKELLVGP